MSATSRQTPILAEDVKAPLPQIPGGRTTRETRRGRRWAQLRRDRSLVIMTLPAAALLAVFGYAPMLGLVMAFQNYDIYDGFLHSPWVGFANFGQLLSDPAFWQAFRNTVELFSVQLVLSFPVPVMLAILLDSLLSRRLRSFIQSVVTLPHFFSMVMVVTIFEQLLGGSGLLDTLLRSHGVAHPPDIMTSPGLFKFLISGQMIWKESGWGMIVYLAALAAISPALYEAAAVDGASWWRRTWHITLPGLRPIMVLLLILNLGFALTFGFEQMLIQLPAVGPGAAQVITTFAYENGIVHGDFSYGAAAGLFLGITSVILILAANKAAHLLGQDGLYRK
ncbi:MAG TPA: ABC transporter permease subunit [Streptosporangiaceae bacterium]|nr:ABC transporter permease subunit [Streptosporangiaceae bacterium]